MIPAHIDVYRQLSQPQVMLVWLRLLEAGHLDAPCPDDIDGEELAARCQHLTHAQVCLSLSRETTELGLGALEILIRKPMYMCARGETGEAVLDIQGNPLPHPIGHRRGEPPVAQSLGMRRKQVRVFSHEAARDPRIIYYVQQPNPKAERSAVRARYELYKVGLSITQTLALGVWREDIRWDLKKGFIRACLPQDLATYAPELIVTE